MSAFARSTILESHSVPLRDGTELVTDVYRPQGAGRWPVLLLRLPYNRRLAQTILYAHPSWYASQGYVVVVQDVRGRWASPGAFDPIVTEAADGADTVAWAASQPWSNGRLGMYGFSYAGMLQLLAAAERPPGLQTIVPALAPSQMREGWLYNGGAFALAFALSWTLELGRDLARRLRPELEAEFAAALSAPTAHYAFRPLRDQPLIRGSGIAPFYFDWMDHEVMDAYWTARQVESRYADIDVPALHIGGWYDSFIDGTLRNFSGARAHAASNRAKQDQRLLVGPWHHIPALTPLGPVDFGAGCETAIDRLQVRWFDLWLRDVEDGVVAEPRARVFAMGANRWLDMDEWPPVTTLRRFFLHSGGRANSREGDGQLSEVGPGIEPPDVFVYDPASPVPSAGGHSCCFPTAAPMGPQDQRSVEVLNAVLVYTSEPLDRDLLVVGPITARLFAASDARDTDWVVRVCDVRPDGVSLNIQEGIVRARHAGPSAATRLLTRGKVVAYDIFVGSTCNLFRSGHRIRVHVTSSSFPAWEPNPNTGRPLGVDGIGDLVVATNMVLHETDAPSAIHLPVLDGNLQGMVRSRT